MGLLTEYSIICEVLATSLALIICRNYLLFYAIIKTLPRDLKGTCRAIKWQRRVRKAQKDNLTIGMMFDGIAAKKPNKVCLWFEERQWTYKEVTKISNRVAQYFFNLGLRKGDTIALFMENSPEYVFVTLGLSKIGVVTSLVNCNLRLEPLQQFLELIPCKGIIFNPELTFALRDVKKLGGLNGIPLYCWSDVGFPQQDDVIDLENQLKGVSDICPKYSGCIGISDRVFYMGTSGTTGLPKAVIFSQIRFFNMTCSMNSMVGLRPDSDVMYNCLPLYHSTGFAAGIGQLLCYGVPLAIRKKFSATNFWKDCCRYKVTVSPYIGEVCRYLMATPSSPYERSHSIRLMLGAGLRSEIWDSFAKRFNIPMINEYYGSTEGNCNVLNVDGKSGAVGFIPVWGAKVVPVGLIKVNEETMEPIRDPKTGFCKMCSSGEPGEMVGKIVPKNPGKCFDGYTDKSSTESKILRNVFKNGDAYFRSGDLLVKDIYGYLYFKDRQGDTFRWKAENVSTFEVESVITQAIGLKDVSVYGVTIPGHDGKAGMATISDTDGTLDLQKLTAAVTASLPSYARPIFVRVTASEGLEVTGSFKMKKNTLKKEGLAFPHPEDTFYIFRNNSYQLLTADVHQQIVCGKIRL